MNLRFHDLTRQEVDAALTPLRQIGSFTSDMLIRLSGDGDRQTTGSKGSVTSIARNTTAMGADREQGRAAGRPNRDGRRRLHLTFARK